MKTGNDVRYCVSCGAARPRSVKCDVWECKACGCMFTVDLEYVDVLVRIADVCDRMMSRWNDGR